MMENLSRRSVLQSLCGGLGAVGLTGILARQQARAATLGHYPGSPRPAKPNT
jgi:hypothetical protein